MINKNIGKQLLATHNIFVPRNIEVGNRRIINKPSGCFWTSSYLDMYNKIPNSDWTYWVKMEEFDEYNKFFLITPKNNLRIYEIDSIEDIMLAPLIYDEFKFRKSINYKLLSKHFDGVHLTLHGSVVLHSYYSKTYNNMNAWDVESTSWFNMDWIKKVEMIS